MAVRLNQEELKTLKKKLLYIMDEVHRLCVKNNIKYSLFYGSLIGAIIHKGFIPWDDDIDIVFVRSEYERFIEVCKKELNPIFELQVFGENNYRVPGLTKIRLKGTLLLEDVDCNEDINHGIWIDITVLENTNDTLSNVKKTKYYFSLFKDKYYFRGTRNKLSFKGLIYHVYRLLLPPFTIKRTALKFLYYSTKYSDYDGSYVFQPYSYQNDVYRKKWVQDYKLFDFEGRKYYAFAEYDEILKVRYPKYKEIPDPKEQKTNHIFKEIKL